MTAEREIRYCPLNLTLRSMPVAEQQAVDDQPLIEEDPDYYILDGLPVVFDTRTCLGKDQDGNDLYEIIDRHALDACDMHDVVLNVNHGDGNHAVARTRNGTLMLETRDDGLHATIKLDKNNPRCVQFYLDVKSGLLTEMSFAFTIGHETYDQRENCYLVDNISVMYDISAVEHPAYPTTSISARRLSEAVAEREKAVALRKQTDELVAETRKLLKEAIDR